MKLSTIIVAKNEQNWIENCLKSIKSISDEIVVVDTGSTDQTVEICKKHGAIILTQDWQGFSQHKNYALTKSSGDWILFLDADERVSKKLSTEISQVIGYPQEKTAAAYKIPRLNILLGQKMKHGGWWPDYVTRLAQKEKIRGWEGELHEVLKVDGRIKELNSPIFHLSHRGINWMLNKSISYIEIEAKLRFEANHPPVVWWRFFRVMFGEFWYRLISKSGYRDGIVGWIEAISQSYNMFLIYVRLWELQQGKSMEKIYEQIDKEISDNGF